MAHPVIQTPPEEKPVKVVYKTVDRFINTTKKELPVFIDALVLLVIAQNYFFFTGIALLFGRTLPVEWLKIATHLSRNRIARKIRNKEVTRKPSSIKVVDLETREPIPLP